MEFKTDISQLPYKDSPSEITIKKQREKENDCQILQQWKDARREYYQKQLDQTQNWRIYEQQFQTVDEAKSTIINECLPIQMIITNKINRLKILHIEYDPKINQDGQHQYRYSISAFDLFKIIHENKQLTQAIIKEVQVLEFQKFIQLMNHKQQLDEKLSWIKDFIPSKLLQLSIDAEILFSISNEEDRFPFINDLQSFSRLFLCLGNIRVRIFLRIWRLINQWKDNLQHIFCGLKAIKKLKLYILGSFDYILEDMAPLVRSIIFGGLASFKQIIHLSLSRFVFEGVDVNDLLAMEQNLSIFFQNNPITDIQLLNCRNFPVPKQCSHKSVSLWGVIFQRKIDFLSELTQINPSMKIIRYRHMQKDEEWMIDDKLFNQLQYLIINNCSNILLDIKQLKSPSNIKYLRIQSSNIKSQDLSMLFPKLVNMAYLFLDKANFSVQALCTIPSQLEQLHLIHNDFISNQQIKIALFYEQHWCNFINNLCYQWEVIDKKWPYLRNITIKNFKYLDHSVWSLCEFKGLLELSANSCLLNIEALKSLKSRGIRVHY